MTKSPPLKPAIGVSSLSASNSMAMPVRRPAAGDGEADAGVVQALHGVLRAFGQHLLFGDERAVHVRQHQGDLSLLCHRISPAFAQSSGRQARPSRASNSSAAAGPLPPAT